MRRYITPPIEDDALRAAVSAVDAAIAQGGEWPPKSGSLNISAMTMAGKALGLERNTLQYRLQTAHRRGFGWPGGIAPSWADRVELPYAERKAREAARKGEAGFAPVLAGFEIAATTTTFDKAGKVARQTVRQKPEAGEGFAVDPGRRIGKVTTQVAPDGRIEREWVRTSPEDNALAVIDAAKSAFESYRGWARLPPAPDHCSDDLLAVYPVADLHLRMLAWGKESGEDYDLDIAVKLIRETFARVVHQTPRAKHAVFLGLGDILHADNNENRTMRSGHILDVDSRYQKGLNAAAFLLRQMIEMVLAAHETVDVRLLPGNHDEHSTSAMSLAMVAFFHGHNRVKIDGSPSPYWFGRFGANLLGAHHGHLSKPSDWSGIMASHRPQDWGETTFRHFFGGHLHHKQRGGEGSGMTWEIMQTPAAKDSYLAGRGYWAGRSMASRVYHREGGFLTGPEINILPTAHRAAVIGEGWGG